ncbi:hypothetical protein SDC9_33899 [bioreactor metagenome]|uniref:Uncharacterized protein n=1 Tax=bioreactor metagenome TaxID=1076179 RepID=A0A644V952_9ZZZZ
MKYFESGNNKIYFGSENKLQTWENDSLNESQIIQKVKLMLKNYLELDNVSFLFGTGTSIHLGAASIRNFPLEVEKYIKENDNSGEEIFEELIGNIKNLQSKILAYGNENLIPDTNQFNDSRGWQFYIEDNIVRDSETKEIFVELEKVLNYLQAKNYIDNLQNKNIESKTEKLITLIKEGLFNVCDIDKRKLSDQEKTKIENRRNTKTVEIIEKNKYHYHEKFVKALLQRPLNLRRANIFTSNYDLAFEYAFDKLGVFYIDGFAGFHKRYFKPETFEYDIFYPGSTTAGKVQRIDKVIRYFKLHGSLSWVNSDVRGSNNLYGIEEKSLELIDKSDKKGDIIIYPSAIKKSYTLDLPYSELFRQFASTINQSQSVLITLGYSFGDEHFNDIIYQALSNPTFTLIVIDLGGTKSPYINELKELGDPRIIILEGEFFGDFLTFSDSLMPDFSSIDNDVKIANTLNSLFGTSNVKPQNNPLVAVEQNVTNEIKVEGGES